MVVLVTLLNVSDAFACSTLSVWQQWAHDREDRAKQRQLVHKLTTEADGIFVARAIRVSEAKDKAEFQITRVLKGPTPAVDVVTFPLPGELLIGCSADATFRNVWVVEGRDYILYVDDDRLTRTGDLKREWPEISSTEETRLIRKALAPNNAGAKRAASSFDEVQVISMLWIKVSSFKVSDAARRSTRTPLYDAQPASRVRG